MSAIRKVFELFPPGKLVSELPRVFKTDEDLERAALVYEEAAEMSDLAVSPSAANGSVLRVATTDGTFSGASQTATIAPNSKQLSSLTAPKPTTSSPPTATAPAQPRRNVVRFSKALTESSDSAVSSARSSSGNSETDPDGVAVELEVNGDRFLGRSQTARSARVAAAKAALVYSLGHNFDPQLYF